MPNMINMPSPVEAERAGWPLPITNRVISALSAWAVQVLSKDVRAQPFLFFFFLLPPRLSKGWFSPTWWGSLACRTPGPSTTRAIVADHVNCTVSATRGDDGNAKDSCERGEGRGRWKDSSRLIDLSCRSGRSYQPPAAGRRQSAQRVHLEPLEATRSHLEPLGAAWRSCLWPGFRYRSSAISPTQEQSEESAQNDLNGCSLKGKLMT